LGDKTYKNHRGKYMNDSVHEDSWVYVAVENPGNDEKFMGFYDQQENISYIPAFHEKEAAMSCLINLPRTPGRKYEVQAVLADELAEDARKNGFMIFMTDAQGRILKKIKP
jgi:TRAP-type mannitol/chloroaromatic compound transport system substrate-binding protein